MRGMNAAHIHLAINHVPVVGVLLGLLAFVVGLLWRSEDVKRLGLVLFVVVGLASVPAYFSGQQAEEIVEELPGVEHDRIEEHEEAGLWAVSVGGALGLLAAFLLVSFRTPRVLPGWSVAAVLLLALVVAGTMARTATLGGELRHQEIR
jgi:uncharacterized membrane protein